MNKKLFGALCLAIACAQVQRYFLTVTLYLLLRTIHCS